MTLDDVAAATAAAHLEVMGGFHPVPGDDVPDGIGTLVLLGPQEPGFWEKSHYDPGTEPPHPIDAFGMPVGGDIEFTDEVTLGRSLSGRRSL